MYLISEYECYTNHDLKNIKTPVNVNRLQELLKETGYDVKESKFLVEGFSNGFDIGYQGPKLRKSTSKNIPFTVGKSVMWKKIMNEVKEGRYTGPYDKVPYEHFIQSPIG